MTVTRTPVVSEASLQTSVIELAQISGWRVAHFRPARTEKGWRTPVSADGAGFPDLVLTRPPELLVLELKAERGKLAAAQREWLQQLEMCGVEIYVWRPSQWAEIQERLTRPRSGAIHWGGRRLAGEAV
jgi:glycine/D-amino acid oxidase-like deaminating enzyme